MKVCAVLGRPDPNDWPKGFELIERRGYSFPDFKKIDWARILKRAPPKAIELVNNMV